MTRLQALPVSLQKSIENRSLLKVISGLNNFNPESVFRISKAAGLGGADLLDIACEPKLLIADEPTTALDVTIQAQILDLLKEQQTKQNMSVILITHNLGIVSGYTDDVAVMYAGKIVEETAAHLTLVGEDEDSYLKIFTPFRGVAKLLLFENDKWVDAENSSAVSNFDFSSLGLGDLSTLYAGDKADSSGIKKLL